MPTERSRKTSKRTVADPHKGDPGDTKRGGSVVERIVRKLTGGLGARRQDYQTSHRDYAKVLEPDYCKARLLEIGVGRRFWQSNHSPENAHTFYERVVQPLRRLHCQGVVETLQEITDDRTPIAVEIIRPGRSYQSKQTVGTPLITCTPAISPYWLQQFQNFPPRSACEERYLMVGD